MIFDSYEAYRAATFKPKVCILGSGPAGTTIARKLGAAGIQVVVLEAGAREFSDESQDFYRGTTVGDFYFDLDITRPEPGQFSQLQSIVSQRAYQRLPVAVAQTLDDVLNLL